MTQEDLAKLGASQLFSALEEGELSLLYPAFAERRFEADDVIISENEPGDWLGVLADGRADVVIGAARTYMSSVGPGGNFGEIALLRPHALRTATVIARSPARVLVLAKGEFDRVCETYAQVGFKIYRRLALLLSERLEATSNDLATLMKQEVVSQDEVSDLVSRIRSR
jgi:CRP-like cAMP-binding protein